MHRTLVVLGFLACSTGCATNTTREAALLLVDEIDSYKSQVQSKIDAESEFHRSILATAESAAGRQAWVDQALAQRTAIIEFTDRAIVRDRGVQVSALQDFLREQNQTAATRKRDLAERRAELEAKYRASFDSLAQKTNELDLVRTQLLNLARPRDTAVLLTRQLQEAAQLAREEEPRADQ